MKKLLPLLIFIVIFLSAIALWKYFDINYQIISTEKVINEQKSLSLSDSKAKALPIWSVVKTKDAFTDEANKYVVFDDGEHRIQISNENPAIWIYITTKSGPMFDNYGELEFRVDSNEARISTKEALKLMNKFGTEVYHWEPTTIGMHIYHGKLPDNDRNPPCGLLSELMSGKELKVRYQVDSLSKEYFKVNIDGLKPLLIEAFGLDFCVV